jgi:hypothetical protein
MAARQAHAHTFTTPPITVADRIDTVQPSPRPHHVAQRKTNESTPTRQWRHPVDRHRSYRDIECQYWEKTRNLIDDCRNKRTHFPSKCTIKIAKGDILEANEQYKVTAVAADLKCNRGIEAQLASRFGRPSGVLQKPELGDVLEYAGEDTSVLFLVTKNKYYENARRRFGKFIRSVQKAIERLAKMIVRRGITEIAMPFLCSGQNQLNWLYVRELLRHNLRDVEVTVTVYYIPRERLVSPRTISRSNRQYTPRSNAQQRNAAAYQEVEQETTERVKRTSTGPLLVCPVVPDQTSRSYVHQSDTVEEHNNEQTSTVREERTSSGPQLASPGVSNLIDQFESQHVQREKWPLLSSPLGNPRRRKEQVPAHRNSVPQRESAPVPPPPGTTTPPQWLQRRGVTTQEPQLGHSPDHEVYNTDNFVTHTSSSHNDTPQNF